MSQAADYGEVLDRTQYADPRFPCPSTTIEAFTVRSNELLEAL